MCSFLDIISNFYIIRSSFLNPESCRHFVYLCTVFSILLRFFKFCTCGKNFNFMEKNNNLTKWHCAFWVISHMRNGTKINIAYSLVLWKPARVAAYFEMSNDFLSKIWIKLSLKISLILRKPNVIDAEVKTFMPNHMKIVLKASWKYDG